LCLGNIGAPPTVNLVREISSIVGFINFDFYLWLPIAVITFFAAAYTLVLYRSSQQGEATAGVITPYALSFNDFIIISTHVI
jgi:NADH-ubiquinone oxidoreductase chain 4